MRKQKESTGFKNLFLAVLLLLPVIVVNSFSLTERDSNMFKYRIDSLERLPAVNIFQLTELMPSVNFYQDEMIIRGVKQKSFLRVC